MFYMNEVGSRKGMIWSIGWKPNGKSRECVAKPHKGRSILYLICLGCSGFGKPLRFSFDQLRTNERIIENRDSPFMPSLSKHVKRVSPEYPRSMIITSDSTLFAYR